LERSRLQRQIQPPRIGEIQADGCESASEIIVAA